MVGRMGKGEGEEEKGGRGNRGKGAEVMKETEIEWREGRGEGDCKRVELTYRPSRSR